MASESTSNIVIRPLHKTDVQEIGRITVACRQEIGCDSFYAVDDYEALFDSTWLKKGTALALEEGSTLLGYGWVSLGTWRAQEVICFGVYLLPRAREKSYYQPLIERLLAEAKNLGRIYKVNQIVYFTRALDNVHPAILEHFQFAKHPISMIGMSRPLQKLPKLLLPSELSIRAANLPAELQVLRSLSKAAFDDPQNQGEPLNLNQDFLLIEARNPDFSPEQIILAEVNQEPVGYLIFFLCKNLSYKAYEVVDFGVIPAWRHRGIGCALLNYALRWMRRRGAKRVLASTFSSNPAINIFWHNGFRPDPARTYNFFTREI